MAADFSAPSFSLGLDLDIEEEEPSIPNQSNQEEEEEDLESGEAPDSDDLEEPQRPVLKRLRRGPPPPPPPPKTTSAFADEGNVNLDDDIEDFSSQEDDDHRYPDISPSLLSHATCSSSKVSLRYSGVLSSQSTSKFKTPKISQAYKASTPASFEASSSKDLFPRLTISPLRKIHLLDSDSDDPSSSKEKVDSKEVDPSNKKRKGAPFQCTIRNNEKPFQSHEHQTESFWKDFSPKENINLATPALDEFCDEYFNSAKDQKVGHCSEGAPSFCSSRVLDPDDTINDFEDPSQQKTSSRKSDHNWNFPHPKPPVYQYFFHDDARIRSLIRERLPHFVPIGAEDHRGTRQFGDDLDYMGQFCPGDGPSQVRAANRKGSERNSKVKQKRPSAANSKEVHPDTGNWVNPRSKASIPKDAGKRRVSAVGGQGGHWYTGQDGRKVYISKNGQELTGQMAYRQYKKENGARLQRGKKKAAAKKKAATTKAATKGKRK